MTGGAIGVETYAKSICLIHNISTSDFKKALGVLRTLLEQPVSENLRNHYRSWMI